MEARNNQNTRLAKKKRQLENFDCALGMIVWVHTFTALESAPTPTACYAASTNPQMETIQGNVPHCLIGQSVCNTGRLGQKLWKTDFAFFLLLFL